MVGGQKRSFGMLGFTYVNQKNSVNKDSEIQRAAKFARANGWYARVMPISKDRAMSPNSAGGAPRWGLFVANKPESRNGYEYPRIYKPPNNSIKIDFGANAGGSIQKRVRDNIIKDRYGAKYRFGPSSLNDFYQGEVVETRFNDEIFDIKTDDYVRSYEEEGRALDYGANSGVMIYNRKYDSEAKENELLNALMIDDMMFQKDYNKSDYNLPKRAFQEWKLAGPNYPQIQIWLTKQKAYDPTLNMRDNIIQIAGPKGWESVERAQRISENFRQAQESSEGLLVRDLGAPKEIDWHKEIYDSNLKTFSLDLKELKDHNPRYDQWINWAFDTNNERGVRNLNGVNSVTNNKGTISGKGRILNTLRRDLLAAKYSSDANQLDTKSIDDAVLDYLNVWKEAGMEASKLFTKDQSWRKIINLPDPQNPQLANVQGNITWTGGGR